MAGFLWGCSGSPGGGETFSPSDVESTGGDYVPGEVIVRIGPGMNSANAASVVSGTVSREFSVAGMSFAVIKLGGGTVEEAVSLLEETPGIDYAHPNHIYRTTLAPDDPYYESRQYCHQRMDSQGAWDVTTGSPGVVVAIVDTGVNGTHQEFSGRMVAGYDYINNRPLMGTEDSDGAGHGTHVAGIVAATGNNGIGVAGLDWQCGIMPVKVLSDEGYGSDVGVAQGIQFAVDNGADIINMSLGGPGYAQVMQDAINHANDNGVLVVVSMGNDAMKLPSYPAACQGVIAVGSTDGNDLVSGFSTRGNHISVSAPGCSIFSTYIGGSSSYRTLSGTSMSSPQVSGLASLLMGLNPGWAPSRVRSVIENTADDIDQPGFDINSGYGRINCASAVNSSTADRYGAMSITVRDGGVVQTGVNVVVRNSTGGTVASTRTAGNGVAYFFFLPGGNYIASSHIGGSTVETGTLTVSPGATISTTIDF